MLERADTNGDGKIDFAEFTAMVQEEQEEEIMRGEMEWITKSSQR